MIKLFDFHDRDFTTNGLGIIRPLSQIEVKETSLNGWYIKVELPIKYNEMIKEGMIVLADTKSKGPQPFIISSPTKTTRKISFTAHHYIFDAENYILDDVRPTNMSAAAALKYVNDRTDIKSPFTTNSDVGGSGTAYFIRRTLLESFDVIQERWGGYFDIDMFHVNLRKQIGVDRGDSIIYGKNLEGLKVFEDWSGVVTKLHPVGFDGITLPEKYLFSELDYGKPYTKIIKFETELEEDDRTEENLIEELRINAEAYLEENEVPKLSYEVESNINQKLDIGDLIHVKHPIVNITTRVISYEYNMITKRITKLTFGNYKRSVKKQMNNLKDAIKQAQENDSQFQAILSGQTDTINNLNKKGHVYQDDNQIMIVDTLPKELAKHVWRWNIGGQGYSESGIEGPYKMAWTMDGTFNTEFIAANSIMTDHLHTSVGSSLNISSNESINTVVETVRLFNDDLTERIQGAEDQLSEQEGQIQDVSNSAAAEVTKVRTELMSSLEQTAEQQELVFRRIESVQDGQEERLNEMATFYRYDVDGAIVGREGDPMQFYFSNDEASFRNNGERISYWRGKKFYVEELEVLASIIIGQHLIESEGNNTKVRSVN